jgi:hypothetical protein
MTFQMRHICAFLDVGAGIARDAMGGKKPPAARLGNRRSRRRQAVRQRRIEQRYQVTHKEKRKPAERKSLGSQQSARQEEIPIFFVTGAGKSGTTWFRRMLDHHPEIMCRGEGWFFGRNVRYENHKHMETDAEGRTLRPASLYNALAEDEYLRMWLERTPWTRDGDVEEQLADLTREAIRLFLTKRLSRSGKRVVGDKTPLLSPGVVGEIGAIMPEAKVIHVIRDGRDVAISAIHHYWNRERPFEQGGELLARDRDKRDRYREDPERFLASGESIFDESAIKHNAEIWASYVGSAHRDGLSMPKDNYAEVRYESLLERPGRELGRIYRLLGVSVNKEVVRRGVKAESFEKRSGGRRRGHEDSTSPLRKGVAGDWRSVFTKRDKAIFKEVAGDLLVELGYEKDKAW